MNTPLVTESKAAETLAVTRRCLQSWRLQGFGPRFVKMQGAVRYRPEDLTAWIESRLRSSTSDDWGGL